MLYILIIVGVFLIGIVPYLAIKGKKAQDKKGFRKAFVSIASIGIVAIVIGVVGLQFQDIDNNVKKENASNKPAGSNILTLKDFIKSYTENAKAINAKYDFDWAVKTGEKADTIKIKLNEYCSILIGLKKTKSNDVSSTTIVIGGDADETTTLEILAVLYAFVQTFNPEQEFGEVPAFVSDLVNQKSGYEVKRGGVIYSLNMVAGNIIIMMSYDKNI